MFWHGFCQLFAETMQITPALPGHYAALCNATTDDAINSVGMPVQEAHNCSILNCSILSRALNHPCIG